MMLTIEGDMTIYAVADLHQRISNAVQSDEEIEINLAGVEDIDTAGVQLLIAAKRDAIAAGKTLRLLEHSATVREVLDLLGLSGEFGDPVLISADAH